MPENIVIVAHSDRPDTGLLSLNEDDGWLGAPLIQNLENLGVLVDRDYAPLEWSGEIPPAANELSYWIIRAVVQSKEHFDSEILGVFDSVVRTEPDFKLITAVNECYESSTHKFVWGTEREVRDHATALNTASQHDVAVTGRDVWICLVDSGINLSVDLPNRRWLHTRQDLATSVDLMKGVKGVSSPFQAQPNSHGSVMAYDAAILAPEAKFVDLPVLTEKAGGSRDFTNPLTSDIHRIYRNIITLKKNQDWKDRRIVVNNSFHMANPMASSYYRQPNTVDPLIGTTLDKTVKDLAKVADLIIAAGNCGIPCSSAWTKPGNTILGLNSHASLLTVAAVNVFGCHLSISSQGPGWIQPSEKPDICFYSHFKGSGIDLLPREGNRRRRRQRKGRDVEIADPGTSAACATATGLVAALRSKNFRYGLHKDNLTSDQLFDLIRNDSVSPMAGGGHSYAWGYGIPDVAQIVQDLM